MLRAFATNDTINNENINKHIIDKRCFKLACQDITNTCGIPQDSIRWRWYSIMIIYIHDNFISKFCK